MISVIMPAFNEELFIEEAVQSVLKQSYKDFELIIINDGSTDSTLNILRKLEKKDSKLRILDPGKLGKNAAINFGIQRANGEWITLIAADDIMGIDILDAWAAEAKRFNPLTSKIVLGSRIRMFSENKKYDGIEIPKKKNEVCKSGSACMLSRKIADELFPLPENFPNEDTWEALYFEFMDVKFLPVPKISINYRIHANNSLNKDAKYNEFNSGFHKRAMVVEAFHSRFFNELTEKKREVLENRKKLEVARYNGNIMQILNIKSVSFKEKMRALFLCNEFLYNVKIKLNRFFLGN